MTEKKPVILDAFPVIQLTPVCIQFTKRRKKKKSFFLQCLSSASDNLNYVEVICWHLKESVKNVIFLEYQNRDSE